MTAASYPDRQAVCRLPKRQWWILGTVLLLLGSSIAYNLYAMRIQIMKQEQCRLMTQAHVIGKNIERQLESTSLALNGLVEDHVVLCKPANRRLAIKRLAVLADAMPGVRTLFITDAAGTILVANRPELLGRNFKHRAYFTAPKQHPDPQVLYISPPFQSVLNAYVFNITRMIPAADGRFNGIVTAGIDPDYYNEILQSALYAPDMWNTINHGDGTRFMVSPDRPGQAGKSLAVKGSMFTRHMESGRQESMYIDTAYATGEHRMAALLTVQPPALKTDQSLVVIISRSPAAVLQGWERERLFQGGLYLLACISSCVIMLLFQRRQQHLESTALKAEQLVRLRYQLLEHATMHTSDELLQFALDEVCRISGSPVGFYHFIHPERQAVTMQACSTRTRREFCTAEGGVGMHYSLEKAGVWAECIVSRAPVIHNDYAGMPNKKGLPAGHPSLIRELVAPVIRDEQVVAVLGVGNKPTDYMLKDAEDVAYLADVIWEIVDARRAQEELKRANELLATEARIDFLTGIYNRRMFDGLMTAELARACRYNSPLSLIMMDLDHFKQINDTEGHATGDLVLQKVAEMISGRIRSHDIFSRWGGEEFVILTPKNDEHQAAILAEILRDMIEQYRFAPGVQATASFGVTRHRPGEPADDFIARADTALYQAKNNGRNRVETVLPREYA